MSSREQNPERQDFPSFSEGLSLRDPQEPMGSPPHDNFPSFSEGLSLRDKRVHGDTITSRLFPFLFGGTFIEGFGS